MNFKKEFEGKKITIMGLGLLGRGIGDAAYLAECGADLLVTDLKSEAELSESLAKLKGHSNIKRVFGEHRMEDFENKDFILVAAGVPFDSPYLLHAREKNIPLRMSAAIFTKLSAIPTIGITGTRGKSTVTHMIHHVLSESTVGGDILLGGNVRGISNLQLLNDVKEDSIAVLELDSWQLQGFGWEKISPQIAVFTNFMNDHLNYYGGSRDRYFEDKAQIFLHQNPGDTLVTTYAVFEQIKAYALLRGLTIRQEVLLVDESILPEEVALKIPGVHNRENATLAAEALRSMGLSDEQIFAGLRTFKGVEGRLQFLREVRGVEIYNDNNATTPEATIAGINALSQNKNIVLIIGGSNKNLDLKELVNVIELKCKEVVLLAGIGTERLYAALLASASRLRPRGPHNSLNVAFKEALDCSESGDIILFSPAFASFGMFKNEYDRNDQFIALIKAL